MKKQTPTSLLCELARLKSQQFYLEKTQNDLNLNFNENEDNIIEKSLLCDIEKLKLNLTDKYYSDQEEVKYATKNIFEELTNFESNMLNTDSLLSVNVNSYREKVVALDNCLTDILKGVNIKLEMLKNCYTEVHSALPPTTVLLRDIQKYHVSKYKAIQNASTKPIPEEACKDVKLFDKFLISCGGQTGFWEDEEHCIYLKYKNKYKDNLDRIIECINAVIPGLFLVLWYMVCLCIF